MGPSVGGPDWLVPLDADELLRTARRSTDLDDFGSSSWEEPFQRLVASLNEEAELHALGRLMCRVDLLRHLRTRLLVVDAVQRDPSIGGRAVTAPMFVTGPARSGTSILHELLGQDAALRAPLAWEMAHPFDSEGTSAERAEMAECEFDLWSDVNPAFAAVHELKSSLPEECIWLFAPEFETAFWSTCTNVPSFSAWRSGTDAAPSYAWHKTMLQILQGEGPARPWALKSPAHLTRLESLFAVYPDAKVIHTHRDPVKTVPSVVSTLAAGRTVRSDNVDTAQIAGGLAFGMGLMMDAVVGQRTSGRLPEGQIADIHYLDLLHDPVGSIRDAYEAVDLPFADDMPDRIRSYLDARPQDKHGVHRYSAADYGYDVDELRTTFRTYTEHFGVESEPA